MPSLLAKVFILCGVLHFSISTCGSPVSTGLGIMRTGLDVALQASVVAPGAQLPLSGLKAVIDAAEDYSKSGDYKKAIFTGTESMTKSMASSNPLVGAALAVGSSMSKGKSIQSAVVDCATDMVADQCGPAGKMALKAFKGLTGGKSSIERRKDELANSIENHSNSQQETKIEEEAESTQTATGSGAEPEDEENAAPVTRTVPREQKESQQSVAKSGKVKEKSAKPDTDAADLSERGLPTEMPERPTKAGKKIAFEPITVPEDLNERGSPTGMFERGKAKETSAKSEMDLPTGMPERPSGKAEKSTSKPDTAAENLSKKRLPTVMPERDGVPPSRMKSPHPASDIASLQQPSYSASGLAISVANLAALMKLQELSNPAYIASSVTNFDYALQQGKEVQPAVRDRETDLQKGKIQTTVSQNKAAVANSNKPVTKITENEKAQSGQIATTRTEPAAVTGVRPVKYNRPESKLNQYLSWKAV